MPVREREKDRQPEAGGTWHAPSVLVVDDDPGIRDLLEDFIESLGYPVLTAAGGEEALEQAQRTPPRLVITDIAMPNMDGIELCRALQRDPRTAHTRVVLMSAWHSHLAEQAREQGAQGYLSKPFDLETVERLVVGLMVEGLPPI